MKFMINTRPDAKFETLQAAIIKEEKEQLLVAEEEKLRRAGYKPSAEEREREGERVKEKRRKRERERERERAIETPLSLSSL